jgi:glucosamine-6-phosphate deaminase
MMNIYVFEQLEDLYQAAAKRIIDKIKMNPYTTLGLATGSSPLGIYKKLIEGYINKEISFQNVKTFNLDEYVGLRPTHSQSYAYFMKKELFSNIDILEENTFIPSGAASNLESEIRYYDALLKKHKIDIQLLGIGRNGHIGFNEPGTPFISTTHIIELDPRTRNDNARFFKTPEEVPSKAITMGIYSIMQASEIILIATGSQKAYAVKEMIAGKIDSKLPASILQTHNNVHVYLDHLSSKEL